ncbi:MAG: pentapeptide repeat-containing protein [Nitrospinae bacterium]|nr:pentapeptide repeat-containing protein [Nitrospinota bacterium]
MKFFIAPFIIFVVALFCATILHHVISDDEYWKGIAIEFGGVTWETLLLAFLLGSYEIWRKKQDRISGLRRRIDDFKCLDNEYAHVMVASSIRELAESGITDIDFRGCKLSNFSFLGENIRSLRNSVFADGFWIFEIRRNYGYIKHVDFREVDCSNVKFSSGNLSFATYENCEFQSSDLQNASFVGASLRWTVESVIPKESEWHKVMDETEDGEPVWGQVYSPAFYRANLKNTNFNECSLEYADFRGALNILDASFVGAKGLDTCFYDEGIRERLKTALRGDALNFKL